MRLFLFPVLFEISRSIELNLHARCCEPYADIILLIRTQWRIWSNLGSIKSNSYNKLKVNVEFSITYILMKLAFVQQIFFSCKMCTKTEIGQWFCRLPISAYYSVNILQRLSISKMHTSVFNCSPKESLVLTIITFFCNWASQETFL